MWLTDCFVPDFLWQCFLFCLPPRPSCFVKVCLPTLLAAELKFFFLLTTLAKFGTPNSNKPAPTRTAASTTYFLKSGKAVFPVTSGIAPKPRRLWRPIPLIGKFKRVRCNHYTIWNYYNWMSGTFVNMRTNRVIPVIQKESSHQRCLANHRVGCGKTFSTIV